MKKHDIEIEVRKDGEVKIHVRGAKGKQCLSYVELFEKIVGPVKQQQLTHEFYEPETPVHIDVHQQVHEKE